jgi:hypothetical protein
MLGPAFDDLNQVTDLRRDLFFGFLSKKANALMKTPVFCNEV